MVEFTPQVAGELMQRILFDEWRQLIAAGWLPEPALLAIRGRLTATNEFEPGPSRDLMARDVVEALAVLRGSDPNDVDSGGGLWRAPDDLGEIG
jgi:hypothetical protein